MWGGAGMESGGEPATQSWEAERMVGRLRRRADLRIDGFYRWIIYGDAILAWCPMLPSMLKSTPFWHILFIVNPNYAGVMEVISWPQHNVTLEPRKAMWDVKLGVQDLLKRQCQGMIMCINCSRQSDWYLRYDAGGGRTKLSAPQLVGH
ncbi:NADH-ubiquinone oxidoreductase B18 subunit [Aspergillus luchuensis]|uniref:NADH-ubiquinone oxidoreductase B18 subunit n=1 Tax=Aspergillus kawachii TaxID=1069201 RepID=A0A146FM05_ASPKA|nr:NADH-ubiquinone oxidoreductase B18 subunit [Aspergillus luchuensis]